MKILSAILVAIALCGLSAASAAAEPGFPDYDFGRNGNVTTPSSFPTPWSQTPVQLAEAPDGTALVAAGAKLLRYLPDGSLDPSFGSNGALALALPGSLRFDVSDLAVDPEGRIVVIGSASPRSSRLSPAPSFATVLRYLPDGELDPSFGARGDGIVIGDFGLGDASAAPAAVTAAHGAVDAEGRITVVVGAMRRVSTCGAAPGLVRRDALITRLTASGSPDPSFGDRGVQAVGKPLLAVASMTFDRGGGIVLAGPVQAECGHGPRLGIVRLHPDGSRYGHFAADGSRELTGIVASIAVDSRNRIVLLCKSKQTRVRDEHSTKIARFLPGGRFDPDFSNGWIVYTAQGPLYRWSSLSIDSRNRPILVGTLVKLPNEKYNGFHRWFMVMPLRESGGPETRFGWLGWLAITRFGPDSDAAASEALIDAEGKLLIAGTTRRPKLAPDGGFALARYELR